MWTVVLLSMATFCGFKWFIRYADMMALLLYLEISGVEFDQDLFSACLRDVVKRLLCVK